MSKRPLAMLAVVALLSGVSSTAAAGPWTPEPGHGYAKIWLKYLYGYTFLDENQLRHDIDYHEVFLSAYAELGLVDHLALVLHAPIVRSFHLGDPRDGTMTSHVSPGDPTLSVRWQFLQVERFVAGAELGLRLPFARAGPVQPVHTIAEGNERVGDLQLGTGVWDVPLTVGVGYGWDWIYLAASAGYILRSDGYRHVLTWSAEGGVTIESQWAVRVRAVGYHSLDVFFEPEAPGHLSPSGIGNGTNYIGFAAEGDFQFVPNYFVGVTIEGGIGVIRRQAGGPVFTLYLAHRF